MTTFANPRQHEVQLNLEKLPAGVYFYTLLTDGVPVHTRRIHISR